MAISSTLLAASIDGALFAAIVWLVVRLVPLSPSTRTLLWWCAAAKFVLALTWTTPIAVPLLPPAGPALSTAAVLDADPAPADNGWTRVSTRVGSRVGPRVASRLAPPWHDADRSGGTTGVSLFGALASGLAEWSSFAALGWIGGLTLLAMVAVRRWRATASLVAASTPAGDDIHGRVTDLATRLRLRRVPAVRVSDRIETPLVTGFVRPVMLLPGARFAALSERQRDMAICHELAHLKRADLWLGCVPALAERLFFFHPLAHVVSREYSLAREAACDAAVVETLDAAPREYGSLLLALGVSRPQAGAAANGAWSFEHLKRRITMLQELPQSPRRSRIVAAAVVAVAVLALVPLRLVARPAPPAATAAGLSAAPRARAAAENAPRVEAPQVVERVEQERGEKAGDLNFVLIGEGQRTVAGSDRDLERARSFQRDGDSLLWVRRNGREYVIRDEDVLRQARQAWSEFNTSELEQLVESHVEAMAKALAESPLVTDAARLGAEVGAHALEMASEALRSVDVENLGALAELKRLKDLEHLKELKHLESLKELESLEHLHEFEQLRNLHELRGVESTMREVREALREIDDKAGREVERSVRDALDQHRHELRYLNDRVHELVRPLREMEHPIRDMTEPLGDMGRHMGALGREISDVTSRAMERMREVIDRAIAAGSAKPVK